jgi:GDPmannose 4,6-dehydratase
MKVLIFGALGQDGFFLTKELISKGHEVICCIRENTKEERKIELIEAVNKDIIFKEIDIENFDNIKKILLEEQPDAICNLLAISNVFDAWRDVDKIFKVNAQFPINILQFLCDTKLDIKFVQASSSLVFGNCGEEFINEKSIRSPLYPYGIAKNTVDQLILELRERKNIKCSSVILFNHESERRENNFFTKKVIKNAVKIFRGELHQMELGDLNSYRDMGCAIDYMKAISLILEEKDCEDYVVGTGSFVKLEDFVSLVLKKLNLNKELIIKQNLIYTRSVDTKYVRANTEKIRSRLNWFTQYTIEDLVDRMIQFEMREKNAKII